ncbi:MAG: hypothetical protein ACTSXO_01125 [Candidatus Heimdallarchaeota archaeon]
MEKPYKQRNFGYLGSLFSELGSPTHCYRNKWFKVKKWILNSDSTDNIEITVKDNRYLPSKEKMFDILESFENIFPKKVINDAKRIAVDTNVKATPARIAAASLYLSSDINDKKLLFECNFKEIEKRINEYNRRKKISPLNTSVFKSKIKSLANDIQDSLDEEKFKLLKLLGD